MGQLSQSILIGLITGLASGVVTGLYSGLIISRVMRFQGLIADALRCVNSVEHMDGERTEVRRGRISNLGEIGSSLMHFGHVKAGKALLKEYTVIGPALYAAEEGRKTVRELETILSSSYDAVRALRPGIRTYLP